MCFKFVCLVFVSFGFCLTYLNHIVYFTRGVFRMFNKGQQYQNQQQTKTSTDGKVDDVTDVNKFIAQLNL